MANAIHLSSSDELEQIPSNDREYLNEWPPLNDSCDLEKYTKRKRPKSDKEEAAGVKKGRACLHEEDPVVEERVLWARPALARWWRKRQKERSVTGSTRLPKSDNPSTVLRYVARLPEGKAFLECKVNALKDKITLEPGSAALHASLASYYDLLQDTSSALDAVSIAMKMDPQDMNIAWLHLKVQRDKTLDDNITCLHENLLKCPPLEHKMPAPAEVIRRHYSTLGSKEFLLDYCVSGVPVIITGMAEKLTSIPWTFQHIKEVVGHKTAQLKKTVKESTEWAKLEPACSMKISDFIDSLSTLQEPLYLFDWSIPTHAPELAKELVIPKYFAGDFLQMTAPGSLYKDSWPSLFIAPQGLHSDLHVDSFGSNFWMALFQGRKRWTLFSREDTPLLYPHYENSMDLVFDVDLSSPDFDRHPLLCTAAAQQCTLQPGELLFVPYGCPHRVENLEDSLAISANFVDLSNYEVVIGELKANGFIDPQAKDLFKQMTSEDFQVKMSSQQKDMAWHNFKALPRGTYEEYDINIADVKQQLLKKAVTDLNDS